MNIEEIKELWGEDLFNVFESNLNEDGWLTDHWVKIIEEKKYDTIKQDVYSRIFFLELESKETADGVLIRPVRSITL